MPHFVSVWQRSTGCPNNNKQTIVLTAQWQWHIFYLVFVHAWVSSFLSRKSTQQKVWTALSHHVYHHPHVWLNISFLKKLFYTQERPWYQEPRGHFVGARVDRRCDAVHTWRGHGPVGSQSRESRSVSYIVDHFDVMWRHWCFSRQHKICRVIFRYLFGPSRDIQYKETLILTKYISRPRGAGQNRLLNRPWY